MKRQKAIKLRQTIESMSGGLDDRSASEVPELFPAWQADTAYAAGDRRRYGDTLYKCLIAHTSQSDWTPDVSPSLWARTDDPGEEWPEWVQPTGATDAYPMGAKVSHKGKHWISILDHNPYEPGVYGWEEAA